MSKSRYLRNFFCCLLCVLVLFCGACGNNGSSQTQADISTETDPSEVKLNLNFAGSSPGGVWYMVMSGVTECLSRTYENSAVTVIPGEGVSNLVRIANGESDIGLTHSAIAAAVAGLDPFEETYDNVSAVASLYASQLQFIVTKASGITSFEQIRDNQMKVRISVDSQGSTGELAIRRVLNAYGITYEDIESWGGSVTYKSMGDSSDMYADGLIDGMNTLTLCPASPITEASMNTETVMLPIDPAICEQLAEEFGYGVDVIPKETYDFLTEDITTISSYTVIVVPKNAAEINGYALAKSIYEGMDYLKTVHVAMEKITPESLVTNTGVELNTGAAKFWKEVGAIK